MSESAVFTFASYPNVAENKIPYNCGIHPKGRSVAVRRRKMANRQANLQARAAANAARSSSPNNPTWHGTGKHAGVAGSLRAGAVK